jgi:hypothetical protein
MQMVQKPAFSGVPGINKNLQITQDSSPWDISEIFFSLEMFKLIQMETKRHATQKTNKKKHEGPLKPESLLAQWNTVSLQEIKKIVFDNHTHERVTLVISAGLLEFAFSYSYPTCSSCWNVSG